jgi:SMC interacting uncharacterized protein involved in chromosome segregation
MSLAEIIISSLAVAIMGLSGAVYSALRTRINQLEDTKVEQGICEERHKGISEDIQEMKKTLTEVNQSLRRIEVQLARVSSAAPGERSER